MMTGSILRQRNLVMPMGHPSHPMKAWGHTRPMMRTMEDTEDQSSSGNSSDEENDPWNTKIPRSGPRHLASASHGGHNESEAKEEAFAQILPVFRKELADVYMNNLAWMKALRKDPIHKKIMATRDDYVNNDMFDQDEAIAAAVDKRKFLLKRLLEDQGRFPEE